MTRLAERPEAPWALVAGAAGGLLAGGLTVRSIYASAIGTAGFEFIYVPLVAAMAAMLAGIWGLALGHVVARLRGRVAEPWSVFWVAAVAAAALPLAAGYGLWGLWG